MFDKISLQLLESHGYNGAEWAMSMAERFALATIISQRKPGVAIEIGTFKGGSLSIISHHAKKAYSIDPNPEICEKLGPQFKNVEFVTDYSQNVLPTLIERLHREQADLGFVLIDGDHTAEGVQRDIEEVLKFKPQQPLWILMHDSFNPDCREGMKKVNWEACEHLHYLDYDFIPGFLNSVPGWEDTMWGGFALAYMDSSKRTTPLNPGELLGRQFNTLLPLSKHH
jgi:hypothetical protein